MAKVKVDIGISFTDITREELAEMGRLLRTSDERNFHAPAWKILGRPGAKWRQLEDYRDRFRPIYLKRLEELKAAAPSPEDSDRLDELRAEAVKAVDVRPMVDLSEMADFFDGNAPPLMVTFLLWHTYRVATWWAKQRADAIIARKMGYWGWAVLACPDDRCCPFCKRIDGTKFSFDDPLSLPFHIGCRCTVQSI